MDSIRTISPKEKNNSISAEDTLLPCHSLCPTPNLFGASGFYRFQSGVHWEWDIDCLGYLRVHIQKFPLIDNKTRIF